MLKLGRVGQGKGSGSFVMKRWGLDFEPDLHSTGTNKGIWNLDFGFTVTQTLETFV